MKSWVGRPSIPRERLLKAPFYRVLPRESHRDDSTPRPTGGDWGQVGRRLNGGDLRPSPAPLARSERGDRYHPYLNSIDCRQSLSTGISSIVEETWMPTLSMFVMLSMESAFEDAAVSPFQHS